MFIGAAIFIALFVLFGAKHLLRKLGYLALKILVVVVLGSVLLAWLRSLSWREIGDTLASPLMLLGYAVFGVYLIRRRVRGQDGTRADKLERDRARGRERTRLPSQGLE